ncbi:MAG: ribonuclease PH [Planctomycetota bacterium]|nr:ribonuclease PH [Planctomycetota bacterium]MDA1178009.1 ribonuclease PH [Planctomycetota bacterium]
MVLQLRHDGRANDDLRTLQVTRGFTQSTPGSVLIQAGRTTVLCTASVANDVPPWMVGKGKGWVTAEYNMLPGSTSPRKPRERAGKVDGRTTEIQRLVGRSLRAIVDLNQLGERSITIDCDVLEADGGTRTLSITGAYMALCEALLAQPDGQNLKDRVLRDQVAAISVGIVNGTPVLDLDYKEDFAATVDMNVVMTGRGQFIEIQGTGEEATFSDEELAALLKLARHGIQKLTQFQTANLLPNRPA